MSITPDPDTENVVRAVLLLARRLRSEAPSEKVAGTALALLGALHRLGPMPAVRLAAEERLAPQSLTRLVKKLEVQGLIERVPRPSDRRNKIISITKQGRQALRQSVQLRRSWLDQAIADDLTPAERMTLFKASELMVRLADTDNLD